MTRIRGQAAQGSARAAAGSSPLTNDISRTFVSHGGLAGNRSIFHAVASLGIQAADALEHAHQLGIVHRDIKPSNLMVDANGHLWITDFGLATGNTITGPTLTGDVLGTLRYMSPKQATGERRMPDGRTDIYSLGVTLSELATLQPAFPAENRQELLRQIADTDPVPPRHWNKTMPRDLETIILKAMSKDPGSRYNMSCQLADDLRRFLVDEPIVAQRPSVWERAGKWSRRHRAVVWSAAMSGVAISLVLLANALLLIAAYEREKDQRRVAETQKQVADEQTAAAQHERAEVLARESTLHKQAYAASVGWAWKAWNHGDPKRARELLTTLRPAPGQKDFRNFAWYCLWHRCQSTPRAILEHNAVVYSVAFSPDGKTVASGGVDRTITLWDAASGERRLALEGHNDDVNHLAFSPAGTILASADEGLRDENRPEPKVILWDTTSGHFTSSHELLNLSKSWDEAGLQDAWPGLGMGWADDINDACQIIGETAGGDSGISCVRYNPSAEPDGAPTFIGWGNNFSGPLSINNNGDVLGRAADGTDLFIDDTDTGEVTLVPRFNGYYVTPQALNDNREVVGFSYPTQPLRYSLSSGFKTLSKPGIATDINNSSDVVGYAKFKIQGYEHAFWWYFENGVERVKDLGTLGGKWSHAVSINNATARTEREIVGTSTNKRGLNRPFIYTEATGMVDLLSCIVGEVVIEPTTGREVTMPADPAWGFTPMAINDAGQIAGDLCGGIPWQAVRLDPVN